MKWRSPFSRSKDEYFELMADVPANPEASKALRSDISKTIEDARTGMWKYLTAGNAGGLVATLGFIGTLHGPLSKPVPRDLFWALIVFAAGLAAAGLRHLPMLSFPKSLLNSTGDNNLGRQHTVVFSIIRRQRIIVLLMCISLAALAVGCTYSFVVLYQITDTPSTRSFSPWV